ncbi:uncharacterized protein N0V89_002101 [Didymosphaeria variabile]|uniref:Uncharacterized protein n=1 Tax=Didymosphaeria variabile TaxID=1932322 RepID=A0A9W8XTS8_9PLEO|nr:uncharacterized protein N0V89_002101 [Didymosphaeria variabile]KAJ4357525.1 hypothetical protein N0V89_002101 [Didymosphaeria variabile]
MAWPGRGRAAYQPSQAWCFATPEEVHGRRVVHDSTNWGPDPTPTPYEAFALEFSTRDWASSTISEGHHQKTKDGSDNGTKDDLPRTVHGTVQAAVKARSPADTRAKRETVTSKEVYTVRDIDDSKIRADENAASTLGTQIQAKAKGKRSKQVKLQKTTVPKQPDNANKGNATDKADEKPGWSENNSVKTKRKKKKKKKAESQKMADKIIFSHAREHADHNGSGAQKAADASTFSLTENKGEIKTHIQSSERAGETTTSETRGIGVNERQSDFREVANASSSIEEFVSLFDLVKETVSKYRMQSPAHFTLHIDVQLSDTGHKPKRDGFRSQLSITFQNYSRIFHWLCRRHFHKGLPTRKIVVCNRKRLPLKKLLAEHFPISEASTSEETLRDFWNTNGKSFDWVGLPTELKEHIIQFCIVTAPRFPDKFHDITSLKSCGPTRMLRSCELVDRLGRWKPLLRVSTQMFDKGLCMTSYSLADFSTRLSKLESYSQISEPNSVPVNPKDPGHLLMEVYRDAPKLYPELKRYGDFSKGIRKIDISFDFVTFYRFFKVRAGGFDKEGRPCCYTYDVFEKMPHLNEIVVRLPKNRKKDWINKPHQIERPLFHAVFPCPRTVFRILYERIAEVLAAYENVSVKNFLEKGEEERFGGLRKAAVKALQDAKSPRPLQLTIEELQEIGMHDGGGLHLTKEEIQQVRQEQYEGALLNKKSKEIKQLLDGLSEEAPATDEFYPIRCECAVSCREQYEFWPDW